MGTQLKIAWRAVRPRNGAKQWILTGTARCVWISHVRIVKGIEGIDLDTDVHLVVDLFRLGQGEVSVFISRPEHLTHS